MNKYRELQSYLIRNFLKVIILVGVVEYLGISILNVTLIPFVAKFFYESWDISTVGLSGIAFAALDLLIALLIHGVGLLAPNEFKYIVDNTTAFFDNAAGNRLSYGNSTIKEMNVGGEAALFLVLVAMLILIIIPFVLGAVLYSGLVTRQVSILSEEEKRKQDEYEAKRNLMLSDIAHDLRTPMTTVAGYAQALSDNMVEEDKKQEYLEAIQKKSERMNELITLLFDYVRLGSEGFRINKEKIDICELVREVAASEYSDVEEAGMEMEAFIPEKVCWVNADRLQISRVITNLITNARRHNPEGTGIGIFVRIDDDIRIMVADNGDEIPPDKAETLFEPFVMGDESRNSKGGTGLGLSIVKKIVEMHDFTIRLVQEPEIRKYHVTGGQAPCHTLSYKKMFMIIIPE